MHSRQACGWTVLRVVLGIIFSCMDARSSSAWDFMALPVSLQLMVYLFRNHFCGGDSR